MFGFMKKMKRILYKRTSSMANNASSGGNSSCLVSGATATTTLSDSLSSINDSGSKSNHSGARIEVPRGSLGTKYVYIYNESIDESHVSFNNSETCEQICLSLAKTLGITPTMLHCFGLSVVDMSQKKYYWIAPKQKPSDVDCNLMRTQEKKVFFRMRFVPEQSNCRQFDEIDCRCLEYLMWQVKWDFLHSFSSCTGEESKTDEARGFSCMLILLLLRRYSEKENCTENLKRYMKKKDLDNFLPVPLRKKLVEGTVLKTNMLKKVEELQISHPSENHNANYIMKWCLQVALKQNNFYKTETFVAYDLDIDSEEFEHIEEDGPQSQIASKQELVISVKIDDKFKPRLTVTEKNERHLQMIDCDVENVYKLEIRKIDLDGVTWWRIHIFRQDGHPEMLYFDDNMEAYSFATCVECYNRLTVDFYDTVCTELVPSFFNELNTLRAHGPVKDEFVKKKLLKKMRKDLYILRVNLNHFNRYDILYLPSISANAKLKIVTLPKIKQVEDGYIVEGSDKQPQDLKFLINDLVREANMFPPTCLRIKPQSEGCDTLYSVILGKEPVDIDDEVEEMREKRKIENQPKVYFKNDLKLQSMLGQGHFTEVYNGLLFEQHQVVVKKVRVDDIDDDDYRLVQEAFIEGIEKLTALADCQYFLSYMGMSMMPDVCMIMKGTSHGSLQHFLQNRDPSLPMLSLHHLLDANIQIASALVYMEEKNCYYGNLHCGNISVMSFDNRTMLVRICDPGLVSLYNRLPLQHPVNMKRLPWLAPELHTDLSSVTAQSEVFSYGTTLWQMFSLGASPLSHDPQLKNETPDQIVKFFADGNLLSCPKFLEVRNEDPGEVRDVKQLLYRVMTSCWDKDTQERIDPKRLLKEINSNSQTYEETYHKYNVIPEYNLGSAAYSINTGLHSSELNIVEQIVQVPDISCLKPDKGSNIDKTTQPNRSENRTHTETTAVLRPIRDQPAPAPPVAQGATNFVSVASPSQRPTLSPESRLESCSIEKGKLVINWDEILGRGHYGAVYKGKLYPKDVLMKLNPQVEPETVVVKVLRHETADNISESLKKEADVMRTLIHPNIVKFYAICHGGRYLVMEYVENNSLFHYVHGERNNQSITKEIFLQLSTDIARGMEYLESQRVIHCDLAARNVLLTRNIHAKISDFGLSKILTAEKDYYRRTADKIIPILWCAPEWVGHKRYLHKSDVWSYGVTIWEMYSYGRTPYLSRDIATIMDLLTKGNRLEQPRHCPDEIYALMRNCWEFDPNNRPDFKQLRIRLEQLGSGSSAQGISPTAQAISSRPKQTAVRRFTPQNNAASNQTNATILNKGLTTVVYNRSKTTIASECPPTENETSMTKSEDGVVNGFEYPIVNAARPSLSNTVNVQPVEVTNGIYQNLKDISGNQTDRKEVIKSTTFQGASCANSENHSTENVNGKHGQMHPSLNGSHILNNTNGEQPSTNGEQPSTNGEQPSTNGVEPSNEASEQLKSVFRQQFTGAEPSSGKENKKSSENILIDTRELHYSIKDVLGEGQFGQVFKATYRGETVALKRCKDNGDYTRFKREFELLYNLKKNSSNIVKFIGLYYEDGFSNHMYVMEYLEGGSLYSYLISQEQAGNVVDVKRKILFLIDIAKGMDCLFQKSVVHGDLTAKNVLLTKDLTAKISDLGWAKQLESDEENVEYNRKCPSFQPIWTAPEVFKRCIYTKFSDTWSYGVVCIETFQDCAEPSYGKQFLEDDTKLKDCALRKLYEAILKGLRIQKPAKCPQSIYDKVIRRCWENEYKDRIRYTEIIDILSGYEETFSVENGINHDQ